MNGTRSDDLEHVMFWFCTGNKEHEIDNFVLFISVKNHLSIGHRILYLVLEPIEARHIFSSAPYLPCDTPETHEFLT